MKVADLRTPRAVLLAAILALSLSLAPSAVEADPDWYDLDWTSRTPLFVDNTAGGALTDYQVEVHVTYDADMLADFDDLRFTDSDGVTELSYWIQEEDGFGLGARMGESAIDTCFGHRNDLHVLWQSFRGLNRKRRGYVPVLLRLRRRQLPGQQQMGRVGARGGDGRLELRGLR